MPVKIVETFKLASRSTTAKSDCGLELLEVNMDCKLTNGYWEMLLELLLMPIEVHIKSC